MMKNKRVTCEGKAVRSTTGRCIGSDSMDFRGGLRYIFTYDKLQMLMFTREEFCNILCQSRSVCEIVNGSEDVTYITVRGTALRLSMDYKPGFSNSHFPYIFLACAVAVPDSRTTMFLDVVHLLVFRISMCRGMELYPSSGERVTRRSYSAGSDGNSCLQRRGNLCQLTTFIRGFQIVTLRTCL
jgi:hypothetical protein